MSFPTAVLLALAAANPLAPGAAAAPEAAQPGRVAIQLPENCQIVSLPPELTGRADVVNICQPADLSGPAPVYGNNIYVPNANAIADLEDHWSQPYIEALIQQGVLAAPTDEQFRPDAPLTHAELTAWLDRALTVASKAEVLEIPTDAPKPGAGAIADADKTADQTAGEAADEATDKATDKAANTPSDKAADKAASKADTDGAAIVARVDRPDRPTVRNGANSATDDRAAQQFGQAIVQVLAASEGAGRSATEPIVARLRPMSNRLAAANRPQSGNASPDRLADRIDPKATNPELQRLARATFEVKKSKDGTIEVARFSKELRGKASDSQDAQPRVSRLEAVVGLVDALELTPPTVKPDAETAALPFRDADRIPPSAEPRLRTALANQIVAADPDAPDLHPHFAATRADVAVLLYRALVKDGRLAPIVMTRASALSEPKFERTTDVKIDVELDTRVAANIVSDDFALDLFADPDSPGVIAIGMAEGTRTVEGGKTSAYWGHTDPGNGKHNLGSFSYQHGAASPERADALQLQRMYPYIAAMQSFARDRGMGLSALELVAGIDLATQAPLAAQHYLANLQEAKAQGFTGMEAIFEARSYSYINPYNGQLEASGFDNDWGRLRFDQARRIAEIRYALDTYGIE